MSDTSSSGPVAWREGLALRPKQTPLGKFFGLLFVAALWNGITGVFVWHLVETFRQGNPERGLALFLSIFVLIGLGFLLAVPYTFLALWNPRPHLTLSRGLLHLGDTVVLEWRFTGRPGRMERLRITLEGREEATYTTRRSRSSSTSTAREVFHTVEILDTTDPIAIPAGSVRLAIPADTMHSFAATHNRVVWTLEVKGEIRRWPDVDEPFEVAVLPALQTAASKAGAAGGDP
jgi:hypothetical protein